MALRRDAHIVQLGIESKVLRLSGRGPGAFRIGYVVECRGCNGCIVLPRFDYFDELEKSFSPG